MNKHADALRKIAAGEASIAVWATQIEAAAAEIERLESAQDVIAEHSGKTDHREWYSQGTWLYPGDKLVVVSAPKLLP